MALLLAGPCAAQGGLAISVVPSALNAPAGATVTFSGTLANTSSTARLFLNDIQPLLTGSAATYLAFQPNAFFANVPGILLPGETYSGPLFSVTRASTSPPADYSGTVGVLGGSDIFAATLQVTGTFTVLWPEETLAATAITGNGATLNASVNPNGSDTSVSFQYGTDTTYGQTTTPVDIGSGAINVPSSATIGALLPGTVYHYRVVATSAGGTAYGADQTFTTAASIPAMPQWALFALAFVIMLAASALLRREKHET